MKTTIGLAALLSISAGLGCAQVSGQDFRGKSARNYAQAGTASSDAASLATSAAVGEAVASACVDVSGDLQQRSPLESHRVLAVEPLREPRPPKNLSQALVGARVYLLASPGLTREWLGRLIECHMARHGGSSPQKPDPLAVSSARVDVVSTTNGFLVNITSRDQDDARRILRESEALGR